MAFQLVLVLLTSIVSFTNANLMEGAVAFQDSYQDLSSGLESTEILEIGENDLWSVIAIDWIFTVLKLIFLAVLIKRELYPRLKQFGKSFK
ncbi:hypothetical protein HDV02_003058 [Globomyces sp. JEL0801]|nr:hypothetical protein HDV02_003058 [Globomyces sp. JEL0801]